MDKNVPDPAKQSFDYNITTWKHWPDDVEVDGIVGMAADAQANIVAQLAFKNLVVRLTASRSNL